MANKPITIKDVARLAEVSISTVSRYLNGNTKIEPLSRMRIEKAIRELEYMPNAAARSLKKQETRVIGIIVSDIANAFFINICKALESVISQYDYNLIICSTYEDRDQESKYLKMLTERRVDAIVISPSGKNNDLLVSIHKSGIPVIIIDRPFDELPLPRLIENTGEVCETLTRQLLLCGHRRIAFLVGRQHSKTAQVRLDGARRAYAAEGVPFLEDDICYNCLEEIDAYNATERLLAPQAPFTAIFGLNPRTTNGFMMYAVRNHIRIPQDISFVGITLKDNALLFPLDIDRAEQDPVSIGLKAGEILMKSLDGGRPMDGIGEVVFPQRIVAGESIGKI